MTTSGMWEVASADRWTKNYRRLLGDGWEPFGVTPVGDPSRLNLYHFRRQVSSGADEVVERAQNIQKVRDYTRTQTLKEVGQWLERRGACRADYRVVVDPDEIDAFKEGRMP